MARAEGAVRVDEDATRALVARARALAREFDEAAAAARSVRMNGARVRGDHVEFGFWVPEAAVGDGVPSVHLEVLTPLDEVRPGAEGGSRVRRELLPMEVEDEFAWLAVRGARLGTRDGLGTLYRIVIDGGGDRIVRTDPLASSLPFGVHGPAEVYDTGRMHTGRADAEFFRRVGVGGDDPGGDPPRVGPPAHILELHVGTATHGGTLADLADLYGALAAKVREGSDPTPAESAFLGYDAIQLMPLEPVVGEPDGAARFDLRPDGDGHTAVLRPPASIDWGYDVALLGSAALEPSLLRSGRPDELVDLAAALHTFPGKPIRLFLDVVYGHAHAAARALLPPGFLAGEGEFGPRPDLRRPAVRAILTESLRRKVDYGVDGVRIDASHDLILPPAPADGGDAETLHGDDYLSELTGVVATVAEVRYRPFVIFEDGRTGDGARPAAPPSYRGVLRDRPGAFAWGPLTVADAEPFLQGFWGSVGWRLDEIAAHGGRWVQGYANHDTLRRAHRRRPDVSVNGRLGHDLPEILRRAYDHPAADLMFYGLLPGVPMTFLAAALRAPWAFFRNVPASALPRTAANEAEVLDWRFTAEDYAADDAFVRSKALGAVDLAEARRLFGGLHEAVRAGASTPAQLAAAASARGIALPEPGGEEGVTALARAFMEDLRDACVVWRWEGRLDPARARASRDLRRIRRERPWLLHDFRERDRLDRRVRDDGGVFVAGLRHAPDGSESVALLANLEGEPWTVVPDEVVGPGGWRLLLAAPGRDWEGPDRPLTLLDAEAVLLQGEP